MTAVLIAVLVAAGLTGSALLGPWLLRQAAPALVRVPRLAVVLLSGGIVVWLGTLLSLGPMLAWVVSGPVLLPGEAGAVCQRCLTAANPFSTTTTINTAVPAVVLLAVPTLAAALLAIGFGREVLRRVRHSRDTADRMLSGVQRRTMLGHDVAVIDDDRPFALTFPQRHGGIAVSSTALNHLDRDELAAVLAHEQAHLRQHHHLVSTVVASIARHLRWVPLIAAAENALPHYLEIAADNQARRRAGLPVLVSALLKLGERANPAGHAQPTTGILHAAGPERIRQLVRPGNARAGAVPAVAVTAHLALLGGLSVAVYVPYFLAVLSGCF